MSVKLQFKHQKYLSGWVIGWVVVAMTDLPPFCTDGHRLPRRSRPPPIIEDHLSILPIDTETMKRIALMKNRPPPGKSAEPNVTQCYIARKSALNVVSTPFGPDRPMPRLFQHDRVFGHYGVRPSARFKKTTDCAVCCSAPGIARLRRWPCSMECNWRPELRWPSFATG